MKIISFNDWFDSLPSERKEFIKKHNLYFFLKDCYNHGEDHGAYLKKLEINEYLNK